MRIIDTGAYVSLQKELIEAGKEASMKVFGNSMAPFLIHERDYIFFQRPERELKRGDMVFYQRSNGQYVMHRIWKVKRDGYYIVGDAQQEIEGPIKREQIFARITKVKRKGQWIMNGDFWWDFFEKIWIHMIPFRRKLMWLYGRMKR